MRIRLTLFAMALTLLTSCGVVCVGPYGDCWRNVNEGGGGGTTGALRVVIPDTWTKGYLSPGERVTLTGAGGTGGYLWRIVSGGGTITGTPTAIAGTFSGNSIEYEAPATAGEILFEIEDSSGKEIPYFIRVY